AGGRSLPGPATHYRAGLTEEVEVDNGWLKAGALARHLENRTIPPGGLRAAGTRPSTRSRLRRRLLFHPFLPLVSQCIDHIVVIVGEDVRRLHCGPSRRARPTAPCRHPVRRCRPRSRPRNSTRPVASSSEPM